MKRFTQNDSVSTDYLRQLLNKMTDHIFFKDKESRFIMINDASATLLGIKDPKDIVGLTDFDLFTEEFARSSFEDEQKIIATGVPMIAKEEMAVWKDGHSEWVSTSKVPLRNRDGEIVGCIGISRNITENKRKERLINEYAERLSETNDKLQKRNDQMAEDLRLAGSLQRTFLPQSYPVFNDMRGSPLIRFFHYYEACSQVGGDLCSVYALSDSLAGVHVYDVMGHGVRAALVTAIVRAIERELTFKELDPAKFLSVMNRRLIPMLQANDKLIFATACYLVVDVSSGKLNGASAGHMMPVLVRAKTKEVRVLEVEEEEIGPALGLIEDCEFARFCFDLETGDSVMMYTDGLIETTNSDGVEYGIDRLLRVILENVELEQSALVDEILRSVKEYSGTSDFEDDVCIIGFSLL